jgi:hypothetical protein
MESVNSSFLSRIYFMVNDVLAMCWKLKCVIDWVVRYALYHVCVCNSTQRSWRGVAKCTPRGLTVASWRQPPRGQAKRAPNTDVPSNADFDPRAKATCNAIDAFLEPLMNDLIKLWTKGEKVWMSTRKNTSHWKCTNLPGLGSLPRQVTKGYKGCVVFLDCTSAKFLKLSKKIVYMGHRRFLLSPHPYLKNKKNPSMGQ